MNRLIVCLLLPLVTLLSSCGGGGGSTAASTTGASTSILGSALKGPIVGGNVTVHDANGVLVSTAPANPVTDSQAKFTFSVPSGTALPLIVTVSGGIDSITNGTPDFPLTNAITSLPSNGSVIGTVTPLSTMAVATAKALGGGKLNSANLVTATNNVMNSIGFGLPTNLNPVSTPVDASNIAQVLKANEAVAEMIRRTATAAGSNINSVLADLANDLTTGAIDGSAIAGVTVSPTATKTAALALLKQAIVSVEVMSNNLTITPINGVAVGGASFTTALNAAVLKAQPTVTGSNADIAQVVVNSAFITQTNTAINVSNNLTGGANAALGALQASVAALVPNIIPNTTKITSLKTNLTNANAAFTTALNNAIAGINVATSLADTLAPVIVLTGANPQVIEAGSTYVEQGSTVSDNISTGLVAIVNSALVNTNVVGTYVVSYSATDAAGNTAILTRTVNVVDTTAPVFAGTPLANIPAEAIGVQTTVTLTPPTATDLFAVTVTNNAPATFPLGTTAVTWTATDANGQVATTAQNVVVSDTTAPVFAGTPLANILAEATGAQTTVTLTPPTATDLFAVTVTNNAPTTFPLGTTAVTWTATDANGQAVTTIQNVVVSDTTAPVITLNNPNLTVFLNGIFTDPGAVAADAVDGNVNLVGAGTVTTTILGNYPVVYNYTDAAGNVAAQVTRTVAVVNTADITPPVITLNGASTVNITAGGTYTDAGATALDNRDGNLTASITTVNPIANPTVAGTFTVTYNVSDAAGNPATQVSRTVVITSAVVTVTSGVAHLGLVLGGTVTAYSVVNGVKSAQLGLPAATDTFGAFQIDIGAYTGAILFELTTNGSATYKDEYTGGTVSMPTGAIYRTILATVPTQPVAITPLTEIATYGALLNGGTAQAITDAFTAVKESFAAATTDIRLTIPADLAGSVGTAAEEDYAAVLAMLAVEPPVDPAYANLVALVQGYSKDMFPERGIIFAGWVGDPTFSLNSLINPTNWAALNNGLRQPIAINPAGTTTKATVTSTPSTPVSVAAITYVGPQFGWTGTINATGYNSANATYFTTATQGCSTLDMETLIWAYEHSLSNLLVKFGVTAAQMGISTNNKLHVMCTNQILGGAGSKTGMQLEGFTQSTSNGSTVIDYYRLVKHEFVHTFQDILNQGQVSLLDRWFSEGMATFISGQTIKTTNAGLTAWKNQTVPTGYPAIINPISVGVFNSSPTTSFNTVLNNGHPFDTDQGYYDVFGTAINYLTTPGPIGAGNTTADLKLVLTDMAAGSTFTQAFDARMNVTKANFQANFYTIMANFLP